MSGFYSTWLNHHFRGKRTFDVRLFRMTPAERIARYGTDMVAELRQMSPEERKTIYGSDFSEYLNVSASNPIRSV
jgi:hypothetical protein